MCSRTDHDWQCNWTFVYHKVGNVDCARALSSHVIVGLMGGLDKGRKHDLNILCKHYYYILHASIFYIVGFVLASIFDPIMGPVFQLRPEQSNVSKVLKYII